MCKERDGVRVEHRAAKEQLKAEAADHILVSQMTNKLGFLEKQIERRRRFMKATASRENRPLRSPSYPTPTSRGLLHHLHLVRHRAPLALEPAQQPRLSSYPTTS